jgi:hypothetical protein
MYSGRFMIQKDVVPSDNEQKGEDRVEDSVLVDRSLERIPPGRSVEEGRLFDSLARYPYKWDSKSDVL